MRRYVLRAAGAIVGAAVVLGLLHDRVPDPGEMKAALAAADRRWLAVAVLAQTLSQAAFAGQQRTLLAALTVRISRRGALAIAYTRSAMSSVLPAGSAVSAAFAVREYKRHGASTATAATAMVLSGLASVLGITVLCAGVLGGFSRPWHALLLVAAAALTTGVPLLLRRFGEARRMGLRRWSLTVGCAMLNWLLDLGCLVAVTHALDLPVPAHQLATVYLTVQAVRQIPLTPGGIGLIEASLLSGLLAAGAPQAGAAAVVLAYRVISFWLVLPLGLAAYLRLRRLTLGPGRPTVSARTGCGPPGSSRTARRSVLGRRGPTSGC
ncbi:lysylphosphatidylglycerol synthase transmembrane domain-containing protein [Paractinoplanes atraurantiacus]|uniref:Lysylphosphatidylglycerol synthase TM region n=1 Tax=Paractinoplanes atraurantiacus TaxID=1036182 RepID=A0A285GLA3_9ACTN|nr:YbhN family protein [Actinoplanes atraurantiacus]SNY23974.1 hypothetical protein SAMN05421748_102120 [Actinoplanes atraurantiacus]